MLPGNYYKHKNYTDVCFSLNTIKDQESSLLLRVTWFNIVNRSNVFRIDEDVIEIKKEAIQNWEQIDVSSGRIL